VFRKSSPKRTLNLKNNSLKKLFETIEIKWVKCDSAWGQKSHYFESHIFSFKKLFIKKIEKINEDKKVQK
jgi:hypothetical protein